MLCVLDFIYFTTTKTNTPKASSRIGLVLNYLCRKRKKGSPLNDFRCRIESGDFDILMNRRVRIICVVKVGVQYLGTPSDHCLKILKLHPQHTYFVDTWV